MRSTKAALALFTLGALTTPVLAQSPSGAGAQDPARTMASPTATPTPDQFIAKAQAGQWRASKLVGVDIYGPDNVKVGDIDEVMVDQNGSVQAIVIGVGGFLGIGTKDVALPFKSVKWEMTAPSTASTAPGRTDTTGTRTNGTAGTGTATTTTTTTAAADTARDYPARGVIQMTREQLQAAPSFRYASDTRSSTDTGTTAPSTAPSKRP